MIRQQKVLAMSNVNLSRKEIKTILCFFFLSFSFLAFTSAESEVITTIILIDREAELVDLDTNGEILKRYVAIPDYFSSGRSHKSSLRKSLSILKDYGYEQDFMLPGSSDLAAEDLQHFMVHTSKKNCQTQTRSISSQSYHNQVEGINYPSQQSLWILSATMSRGEKRQRSNNTSRLNPSSFVDQFYPRINDKKEKQHQRGLSRSYLVYIQWNVYT